MNTAARRAITLGVAIVAMVAVIVAMLLAPRFFTGEPEASYIPASAQLAEASPVAVQDLDPNAAQPDPAVLTASLDAILADKSDKTSFNAQVVDVATGNVLYDRNSEINGTPASSLKVVTAIAALDALGGDTQLSTSVLLDGGTLVLRGGGDVLLGDRESDPTHPKGYAGLATLAKQAADELDKRGIEEVELWLDDSLFGDARNNPAWDKSLFTSNNIGEVYPIAHYAGRAGESTSTAYQSDAAQQVRKVFAKALAERVKVTEGGRGPYAGGQQITEVKSAPLRDVIKHMLLVSDNYIAETMGRLVALNRQMPAEQAGAAVAAVAQEHGASDLALFDTSGLAAKNKISPASLTAVLRSAATSKKPELREVVYSLPVAGYNGTLMNRLGGSETLGLVRAKTGSLTGVATLTGMTMTEDGRLLAFSIFANQPNGTLAPHKPTIDSAVTAIRGCGCRV
ncbi:MULTISPECIES: D-alanyl-D-alanine carboxypeptidase/D-alanyl-D-alanine endopeptidase [Glutamicibacter]|uniref:Serine-type D-Ala-D-Ala carboxypeptidase n=1 Tax=Glutamicibacter arilaitensis (strain DSM 16368 / CIP 108037 / IAM 15318 / JCM 13566 / NCIMB 14258 / Re117) TaxID=861360 RepID=A0ABM9PSZ0_GLUAR|nr:MULTISPECIES: D-alanyl-D-alanine carboxypeptidase/D-alanyl-D-alanine-endopeptidase [Glutamicibacter]CBT74319.1 putative serine-type D-Ala-D-Ala carboxypeptidase [Glutamicibacter arilaitensis Re117]HCH46643.1 D-alanyl-D-alanine carboxypeptidase/D-alanyl-D-alanine-endopeptidase [Glutamicibacter sp.]